MSNFERVHEIHSDCQSPGLGIDIFEIEKDREKNKILASDNTNVQEIKSALELITGWLPAAAEAYRISANIKDYVLAPVVIIPSGLPNKNGVGFPLNELTCWNNEQKMLAYRTFAGSPTYKNHDNKNPVIASGVIFDVAFRKMHKVQGDIWKVTALCGFDRNKEPLICNRILTDPETTYSMGAWASAYTCSVCGNGYKDKAECEHVKLGRPEFKLYNTGKKYPQLAYYEARGITGFETSFVENPAYDSARVTNKAIINLR